MGGVTSVALRAPPAAAPIKRRRLVAGATRAPPPPPTTPNSLFRPQPRKVWNPRWPLAGAAPCDTCWWRRARCWRSRRSRTTWTRATCRPAARTTASTASANSSKTCWRGRWRGA